MKLYAMNIQELKTYEEEKVIALLDVERRKRVKEIKHEEDRLRSIGAGLLLRYAYRQAGHSEEDWKRQIIEKGEFGKPYLKTDLNFCYSLSHSGNWVVCCTNQEPVGIDIQEEKKWNEKIAQRFFAKQEYAYVKGQKDEKQKEAFYKIWTAKESFVKYTGTGLQIGLEHVLCDVEQKIVFEQQQKLTGEIAYIEFEQAYCVCVCTEKKEGIMRNEITKVKVPELLEGYYA